MGGVLGTILLCGAMLMLWPAHAATAAETHQVIAAPQTIGQAGPILISTTDEATALPRGLTPTDALMALLAILVLVVFVRRRWLRLAGAA